MPDSPASNKRIKLSAVDAAHHAVDTYSDSDIEMAVSFLQAMVPDFLGVASSDRLVKVGRSLKSLVALFKHDKNFPLDQSLNLLMEECQLLASGKVKVPTVKFGRTGLDMPIVSLGCMRFQQKWGTVVKHMNHVGSDCQDNLVAILKTAILEYGITHLETARAYGSSELQMGAALKVLFATTDIKREDLIIQSKVNPSDDLSEFRANLELSFANLQVDYLDLFAFHGLNAEWMWPWMFEKDGDNCWSVIQEYVDAGKIKHVGFSTHGPTDFICKCIETGKFAYVNLHHHFCGSYTASGDGGDGKGNAKCIPLLKKHDIGVFVISQMDKGGKTYAPSNKLRSLTLPDMEPMQYGCAWTWNHEALFGTPMHTFSVGAARPSDLDQPAVAAYLQGQGKLLSKVRAVTQRLDHAREAALGKEWMSSWHEGLPKAHESKYGIEHNQIVWMYNSIQAFGLLEFARDRYRTFEGNTEKFDADLSLQENIVKVGQRGWGYTPGFCPDFSKTYSRDDLAKVPEAHRKRIQEVYQFVKKWCAKEGRKHNKTAVPFEWETAYEMKTFIDYPDRKGTTVFPAVELG